jgi:hypothetical protein
MDRIGCEAGKRFHHTSDKKGEVLELLHIKENIKGVNIMTLYQVTSN